MNIKEALAQSAEALRQAGVDDAGREARSMLEFATGKDTAFLIAHPEYDLQNAEIERFTSFVVRRAGREPFHYITGTREFFGREFFVEPGVLIPRPETEFLVECAIDRLSRHPFPRFIEIGVGSGCVAVSILKSVSDATAVAVDVSDFALRVASANAARHLVSDRLELRNGSVFAGISERFDLIVSNPPYVPDDDLRAMQPEVAKFEPHLALFGGSDGLDIVRKIAEEARNFLNPNGVLAMEIGFGQSEAVRELLESSGWTSIDFIPDLKGIERVATASRPKILN